MRKHQFLERVAAARLDRLAAGRGERLSRHAKRKLCDDQPAQRLSRNIDALPERCGAEQDRAPRFTKTPEKYVARLLTVYEQGPACVQLPRAQLTRDLANVAMAREEHEQSAIGCRRERIVVPMTARRWPAGSTFGAGKSVGTASIACLG
jgi:hypothetical protein